MQHYDATDLRSFAAALLCTVGLDAVHAGTVADILVAADLLGHSSHGLALLPRQLDELGAGRLTKSGHVVSLRDNGASVLLDGKMLPGPAVMVEAVDLGLDRLAQHGAVTVVIRRSGHIACLGAYLERATNRGALLFIASSNPSARIVAPFGGIRPVYSPNPIAFGIPTEGDPILIDLSLSAVAVNVCREYRQRGELLPSDHLRDADGRPSRDPAVLFATPPGTIMPLGGTELGYKGFALGLMVEALTAGLGGFGRSDEPQESSNAVVLHLLDPRAFGGGDFLLREMTALADACREASAGGGAGVRLPGERALAHRRHALQHGLALEAGLVETLTERARVIDREVRFPVPFGTSSAPT